MAEIPKWELRIKKEKIGRSSKTKKHKFSIN